MATLSIDEDVMSFVARAEMYKSFGLHDETILLQKEEKDTKCTK